MSGGICSNCHEELWIQEYQGEFLPRMSEEFIEKAESQRRSIRRARIMRRQYDEDGERIED
jgi:hypothetical protein